MPRPLTLLITLFTFVASAHRLGADAKWIKVSTAHFSMFTTNGERRAKDTLLHFEQVRMFFQKATKIVPKDDEIVQVVAFQSEKEYKPYQLNAGATAYYQRTQSQDYIVMGDIEVEHYPVAVHEYTHLVIEHSGLKVPIWLNEGLADLYSTLEPQGQRTMVGRPAPGREQTLRDRSWIDLATLFGVTLDSPYYSQPDKMQIFYAESWLLTNMLAFGETYRPHFGDFETAINHGAPSAEAIQKVYGKDLKALTADLRSYYNGMQSSFKVVYFPIDLSKPDETVQVAPADNLALRLTLTELLIGTNRTDQATAALTQLKKEYPESASVEEAQMDFFFQHQNLPAAQEHCLRAFDLGSKNAQMLSNCAALANNAGVDPARVAALLQRALEAQPDSDEARVLLGFTLLRQDKFGQALATLRQVKTIPAERASPFYLAEGYAQLWLGKEDEAKQLFLDAKKWARTPADTAQADHLLEGLERNAEWRAAHPNGQLKMQRPHANANDETPTEPTTASDDSKQAPALVRRAAPAESPGAAAAPSKKYDVLPGMGKVTGLFTKIDCSSGGFRFHLTVTGPNGKSDQVFLIANPDDVVIQNTGDTDSLTFACGDTLNRPATVYFAPPPATKAAGPLTGTAKRIEFERKN